MLSLFWVTLFLWVEPSGVVASVTTCLFVCSISGVVATTTNETYGRRSIPIAAKTRECGWVYYIKGSVLSVLLRTGAVARDFYANVRACVPVVLFA